MGAFLPYHTIFKEPLVDSFFDSFSIFRERENIGPFPRLCVCRSFFFFPSVGLDGGRLMSLPPYWVCFKLTSHSWSHWWIRKGWGNLIAMAISFVRRYPWKMKHDLLLNVTASQFSAFFFLLKIQWQISAHSSCLFHLLCMKTAFSFFVGFVLVFWVVFLFFSFFFFSYFEIRKLTLVLGRFLLKVVETC